MQKQFDIIVIGGGQSGLAAGYYLRRANLSFTILDMEAKPGGSWQHHWESLRLFSPAQWSSLPGVLMSGGPDYYPTRDEAIEYIKKYEAKYNLPVERPVEVINVTQEDRHFTLETSKGVYFSRAIVSATGSFRNPYIPRFAGMELFKGKIIHSSQYQSPKEFSGMRVAIVGEGNSGAQILAEVSHVAETLWITKQEPTFLPDHVDGRYLFDAATKMYEAKVQGKDYKPPSLGDIVMVPPVKNARARGVLETSRRPFEKFVPHGLVWSDGHEEKVEAVIFCTGFKASLNHLSSLHIINSNGIIKTKETKATDLEGVWMVGYGNWTGFASATLIGVGRSARQTVEEIKAYLDAT